MAWFTRSMILGPPFDKILVRIEAGLSGGVFMLWETHLRGPPRNVRDAPFGNGIDDVISAEALEAAEVSQIV